MKKKQIESFIWRECVSANNWDMKIRADALKCHSSPLAAHCMLWYHVWDDVSVTLYDLGSNGNAMCLNKWFMRSFHSLCCRLAPSFWYSIDARVENVKCLHVATNWVHIATQCQFIVVGFVRKCRYQWIVPTFIGKAPIDFGYCDTGVPIGLFDLTCFAILHSVC